MYQDRKAESMIGSFCQQTKCQAEYARFNLTGNEETETYWRSMYMNKTA